ncbi:MAG: acyl carrier protein [Bacteroidetes bacterium GWF2_40_14]|nr:MAG: acyl carrier protein [Bacteroidetes bacterium GWF2_40_14]
MELEVFVAKFAAQFELTNVEDISADTDFKELDEWDSLVSLSVIGMVKNEYKVKIAGSDIKNAKTVEDLYNLVKSRM